jgi:hypothetical protein
MNNKWRDDIPIHHLKVDAEPLYHDEIHLLSNEFPIVFLGTYYETNPPKDLYFSVTKNNVFSQSGSEVRDILLVGLYDIHMHNKSCASEAILRAKSLNLIKLHKFHVPKNSHQPHLNCYEAKDNDLPNKDEVAIWATTKSEALGIFGFIEKHERKIKDNQLPLRERMRSHELI